MSVLVIAMAARSRLAARDDGRSPSAEAEGGTGSADEWPYVLSPDGLAVGRSGRAAAALLPKADTVVAVLGEADVSWHRITLPRAPASRMRAALIGVLEEALLDEPEAAHFALAPPGTGGALSWVAVAHRPWLAAALATLESNGLVIDRVVPALEPGDSPAHASSGHFWVDGSAAEGDAHPMLALANVQGVSCVRLAGSLGKAMLAVNAANAAGEPGAAATRWTATPAAAAAAEQWLGAPVAVLSEAERLLRAARSRWNLRQFELLPRRRGTKALRDGARRFFSPEWRPVRLGLLALVLVQIIGINAWAWQLNAGLTSKRLAMVELLRNTHPRVRDVLDAPLQMERETVLLRAAAGRPGDADLEVLLAAAATAWPDGQGPVQTLRFENGKLTLAAPGFTDAQLPVLRERLLAAGFDAEWSEGRLTVARAMVKKPA